MWSVDEAVAVGGMGAAVVYLLEFFGCAFRGEVVVSGIVEHLPCVFAGDGSVAKAG